MDNHGGPVRKAVWDLAQDAIGIFGLRPPLIEWDTEIPELEVLLSEAERARIVLQSGGSPKAERCKVVVNL